MKHFIIEIIYTIPLDAITEITPAHREYLQIGYDTGMLLLSGPQVPRTGGIVIGRAETKEQIVAFFEKDPYQLNGAAKYRFIEFNPGKRQPFLEDWIEGNVDKPD
jgi:uncharacterized protein YciI